MARWGTKKLNWTRWRWLQSTVELQQDFYDVDYDELEHNPVARADYLQYNLLALFAEAGELQQEIQWKPWGKERGSLSREAVLKEAVDVGHFLANVLCAVGITDDEWEAAYQAKQNINRQRMTAPGGYDAKNKCSCGRAFDDSSCTPEQCYDRRN